MYFCTFTSHSVTTRHQDTKSIPITLNLIGMRFYPSEILFVLETYPSPELYKNICP